MKFEHILQVYWSKGLFFAGKLYYTHNLNYNKLVRQQIYGLGLRFIYLLKKRLELTTFSLYYTNLFFLLDYCRIFHKIFLKIINIIFSQINSVNLNLYELKKFNILKKYLTKSYKGYCHAIGKPVRGQRTWSNAWNSYKSNNILRNFITKTKYIAFIKNKVSTSNKIDFRSVKKQYLSRTGKTHTHTTKPSNIFKKIWF